MTVEHPFNKIVEGIGVSDIRQFDAEVSSIPGIIKLTLGEPNFDTPEHIKEAAIQAIKDNHSHYTPNSGIPELRQAAAEYYNKKFNSITLETKSSQPSEPQKGLRQAYKPS